MTQQEKFEQWWCSPRESFALDMTQEQKVDMWVWEAYQAATQAAQVEIETLREIKIEQECRIKEIRLDNQKLRELIIDAPNYFSPLDDFNGDKLDWISAAEALSLSPQSLTEHDNETIVDAKSFQKGFDAASAEIEHLKAENIMLRAMIYDATFHYVPEEFTEWHKAVENLAETATHSLIEHDDEVIERCAVVAMGCIENKACIAAAIRELKGKL